MQAFRNAAASLLALAAATSAQAQPTYKVVSPDQRTTLELIARDG